MHGMNGTKAKRLYSTKDAGVYINRSPWQLRQLVRAGEIPVVRRGDLGRFDFDVRDLDAYIEKWKRRTPD